MIAEVFISHSSEDKQIADAVCHYLEAKSIRCWIAPRDIPHGHEWADVIADAIPESRVVVLVFSANANASPMVKREILHAVNKEVIIIPFRIENVLPEKAMELFISVNHWLDAITPPVERHLNILAENVEKILSGTFSPVHQHDPIREIDTIATQWVEANCPYEMLEDFNRKLQLFLREPPDDVVFKEENTLLMMMMAGLHFGANWAFWVKRNEESQKAVNQLLVHLNHHYFRPRLRALYALQHFSKAIVQTELMLLADSVSSGNRTLIEKYVYSQSVMEYVEKLEKALDLDMGVKVAAVKREIEKYWGDSESGKDESSLPIL